MVLSLDKVPPQDAYCPGTELMLYCSHNTTNNDPAWKVINGTEVIFRGITFRDSNLEAHSVIVNMEVLEVVQINSLRPVFHGLRYLCLYDTSSGERKSNEVTVKLHGVCVCACACMYICVHACALIEYVCCVHVYSIQYM